MKNKLILGLAISMISTSMAVAAPMKAAKAPRAKTAAVKAAAVKAAPKTVQAAAVAAEPAAPVAAAVPSEPPVSSGQSASTVAAATSEVKKSKFGMLLVDRAYLGSDTANRSQTTEPDGWMTLRPSYKTTDSTSVAVGIDVNHSYGSTDSVDGKPSKAKWTPLDAYLMASHSKLGTLPGEIKVKGNVRFYLPTSELSQDMGQIGSLRTNLSLTKEFGKLSVKYSADPRIFFQQYNTFQKAGTTKQTGTTAYSLYHYVDVAFQATEKLSIYTDMGLSSIWYNGDDSFGVATKQKDILVPETGVEYAVSDNLGIIAGVGQFGPDLRDRTANNEPNAVYREDTTSYFVEADVTF